MTQMNRSVSKATHHKKLDIWVCGCGSLLQASYNIKNLRNCPNEDRVCARCFRKKKGGTNE